MKQLSVMFPCDVGAMTARLSPRNQSRKSKVIFSFSFYRDLEWHIYFYMCTYAKIVDLYVYINVKIHLFFASWARLYLFTQIQADLKMLPSRRL